MKQFYKKLVVLAVAFWCISASAYAQNRIITGTITDKSQGSPIPGLSIKVKNTTNVVVTDGEGKYRVSVPAGPVTLQYLYIGMVTQEIIVPADRSVQDVVMLDDNTDLNEVVVVGYSTQKRSDITSATGLNCVMHCRWA